MTNLKKYIIHDGDTLQTIAKANLGASSLWTFLADFNKLEYPFISEVSDELYAEGYVTFYRNNTNTSTIIIPKGTILLSTEYPDKSYETIKDINFSPLLDSIEVGITSRVKGLRGEIPIYLIDSLYSPLSGVDRVSNNSNITSLPNKEKSSGIVIFKRKSGTTGNITIPEGFKVYTKYSTYTETVVREFYTTEEKVLSGEQIEVNIICAEYGNIGNVNPRTITIFDPLISDLGSVLNESGLTNGYIKNIARTGDQILIPTATNTNNNVQDYDVDSLLYGEDIALGLDNDLMFSRSGDFVFASGVKNMSQAIRLRLNVNVGEMVQHPTFGNLIKEFIGVGGTQDAIRIVKTELYRMLLAEDRISKINDISVLVNAGVLYVNVGVTLIGASSNQNFVVI